MVAELATIHLLKYPYYYKVYLIIIIYYIYQLLLISLKRDHWSPTVVKTKRLNMINILSCRILNL